jgi:hypothetical protein
MHEHTEMTLLLLVQSARDPSKAEYNEKRLATLVPEAVAEGRKLFAAQPKPELVLAKPEPEPKSEPKSIKKGKR